MNAPRDPSLTITPALLQVAVFLRAQGYTFTTVTPATHARVNARRGCELATDLRGVFGWNRPFAAGCLPPDILSTLRGAGLLEHLADGLQRSAVRFSTIDQQLFAHSAFPTSEDDAVFFGPDTYRFVAMVREELSRQPLPAGARILDVGCGGGAGGVMAALACGSPQRELHLCDINPRALRFAAANAAHAGCGDAMLSEGDLFEPTSGEFDLIIANPPYLNDTRERLYRHGGGRWGEGLSQRIVREGLPRLAPGGRLLLYTGVAVVDGEDPLLASLAGSLATRGWPWHYRELDPDVFGEELSEPAYLDADRIAVTALTVHRPDDCWATHLHPAMA